jgi:excisionase family DNA binding protein
MLTAEKVIKEIYRLPLAEREKIAYHIVTFGIKTRLPETPELLNLESWQNELAEKPFNLKEASEYLGISIVTLRRWVKAKRLSAYKIGRAYSFEVRELKQFKRSHLTTN